MLTFSLKHRNGNSTESYCITVVVKQTHKPKKKANEKVQEDDNDETEVENQNKYKQFKATKIHQRLKSSIKEQNMKTRNYYVKRSLEYV